MAGYSGQLVALDAETPTEEQLAQGQADQAQAQSQLTRATMPAEIAIKNQTAQGLGLENQSRSIANQSNALTLQQQMQLNAYRQHYLQSQAAGSLQGGGQSTSGDGASPLGSANPATPALAPLFDPQVQQVMLSIDPNDPKASEKFDTQMGALGDEVPQAKQFVGNYSRANLQNWQASIGAHGMNGLQTSQLGAPSSAPAAAGGAPSPLALDSPLGDAGNQYLKGMSILDPKGTGEMLAMQGMIKYQQTGDLSVLARYSPDMYEKLTSAQKNLTEAQKEGVVTQFSTMGQQANAVLALAAKVGNDNPAVRAAYNQAIAYAAKQGWVSPEIAQREMSQPIDFAQLAFQATRAQTVTEALKSSGVEAGNEAAARAAHPEPNSQYIGTDAQGRPIYHNTRAAPGTPDTVGNLAVNAKPSAGAATFEVKKAAYLQVHPDDDQGAIEFANGQRTLPPGEAAVAAQAAASRDAQTAALTGAPFDEKAAYQGYLAQFQGAGAAPAPGGGAPSRGAAPDPGALTQQQHAAAQAYRTSRAPTGTKANPAVPINERQYNALPKGAVYIRPDGSIRTKT